MLITLNDVEQRICKYMALKRFEYCRKIKTEATVYGTETAKFREFNSYGGELAFCRHFNIYPDTEYERFGVEDCKLNGNLIDVKTTTVIEGRLVVKAINRKETPDYYALVVGRFPSYSYIGMISSKNIISDIYLDKSLPHPAYCVAQSKLSGVTP